MANPNRPWIKLWVSFLRDPAMRALSAEDRGRWIDLLLLVAENGQDGVWETTFRLPTRYLYGARGTRGRQALMSLCKRLPGVTCVPTHEGDIERVTVTFTNWRKYQEAGSKARTTRWRQARHRDAEHASPKASHAPAHGAVTVTPDVTKKRGEVEKTPLSPVTTNGRLDPALPYAQRTDRRIWTADGYPRAAFRTDCPDDGWRLRCVDTAFLETHPEWRGKLPDGPRGTCPHHRAMEKASASSWP